MKNFMNSKKAKENHWCVRASIKPPLFFFFSLSISCSFLLLSFSFSPSFSFQQNASKERGHLHATVTEKREKIIASSSNILSFFFLFYSFYFILFIYSFFFLLENWNSPLTIIDSLPLCLSYIQIFIFFSYPPSKWKKKNFFCHFPPINK